MLRPDLCDFSDAYIIVKEHITITITITNTITKLALKNNATFLSCISKTNNTLIDNADDLDIV